MHRINSYYLLADGWKFSDKDIKLSDKEKMIVDGCKEVIKEASKKKSA